MTVAELVPGLQAMTVEDLITALEKMPQSYPVMAGWLPRWIDPEWADEAELPVLRDVQLIGGAVVLA